MKGEHDDLKVAVNKKKKKKKNWTHCLAPLNVFPKLGRARLIRVKQVQQHNKNSLFLLLIDRTWYNRSIETTPLFRFATPEKGDDIRRVAWCSAATRARSVCVRLQITQCGMVMAGELTSAKNLFDLPSLTSWILIGLPNAVSGFSQLLKSSCQERWPQATETCNRTGRLPFRARAFLIRFI